MEINGTSSSNGDDANDESSLKERKYEFNEIINVPRVTRLISKKQIGDDVLKRKRKRTQRKAQKKK